jgi:hypothetical protein
MLLSRSLVLGLVLVVLLLAWGCTGSIEMTYTPSVDRLPQADQLKGIKVGIAKLEDRRSSVDRTDAKTLSYFMEQGLRRFALTHRNKDYAPVTNIIQELFVEEFTRAGIEATAVDRVLSKDALPAMREAGTAAKTAYVLGGRIHVFEVVNEPGVVTVTSRRAITLEIHLAQVATGALPLDTTVSFNDRRDEGMGSSHRARVDRLMNTVFRQVVSDVVEKVAAKLN